jgi:hypothetical protein
MVSAAQVKDFLFDVSRSPELRILRAGLGINQGALAGARVGALPLIGGFAGDAEVAAGCGSVANLCGIV